MKRYILFIVCGLALAGFLFAVFTASRPQPIRLTLVDYRKWPHGATLRLTNGTRFVIYCFTEQNGTPAGSPILSCVKTSGGWTNTSPVLTNIAFFANPITGKIEQYLSAAGLGIVTPRELKPGRSLDFFVRLEPGAFPRRIGTVCSIPQMPRSELRKKVEPLLAGIKPLLRMKTTLPDLFEVWCPDPLYIPALPEKPEGGR